MLTGDENETNDRVALNIPVGHLPLTQSIAQLLIYQLK